MAGKKHVELIRAAFGALRAGDAEFADRAFQEIAAAAPRDAEVLHGAGILGLRIGRHAEAERLLEQALRKRPGNAALHCTLGLAYRQLGRHSAALEQLQLALTRDPALAEAHAGLGRLRLESGEPAPAAASFERALELRRDYPDALAGLAAAQFALAALEPDPARRMGSGLDSLAAALELEPANPLYWAQFGACIRFFSFRAPLETRLRSLLERALAHPAVDPADLARPITSLALSRAGDPAGPDAALAEPLFLRLLEAALVRDPLAEQLVGRARRALLDAARDPEPALPLEAAAALAHQAFNTEYVYDETDAERAVLEGLREALAPAGALPLHAYAAWACYRPLHQLDAPQEIAAHLAATPLGELARRQILEPLEERRLRATIPALTGTADAVSTAVREQYEQNPYPRWLRGGLPPEPAAASPHRVLIAGCGTGRQSIVAAQRFPGARVLAVDLSLASLAYAERKTLELGIANLEYRQADLLELGALDERFDLIECSGVLHHLAEPAAGWRVLLGLLAPDGIMQVGLYSEAGRRHVARARELIAAEGWPATPDGIRRCRAAIRARADDPLLAKFVAAEDFYSLSGCRDLLFHVQEHRFTLPQIAALLEELELEFLGFELDDGGAAAARYRACYPDDDARGRLERWHALEQEQPDMFARMYHFRVRRRA